MSEDVFRFLKWLDGKGSVRANELAIEYRNTHMLRECQRFGLYEQVLIEFFHYLGEGMRGSYGDQLIDAAMLASKDLWVEITEIGKGVVSEEVRKRETAVDKSALVSTAAEKDDPPDKLSIKEAAELFADLTGTLPDERRVKREIELIDGYRTVRSVCKRARDIQKKKKTGRKPKATGRYKCSACGQRATKVFKPLHECRECFMNRHAPDDTPVG